MINTVLFDLDGTLLPMDNAEFIKYYFSLLCKKVAPLGYDADALVSAIWAGTADMVANDGSELNEPVFWRKFTAVLGERVGELRPIIEEFYSVDFNAARVVCGQNPALVSLVHELRERGVTVALATNPLFPAVATENRIRWAGLEPSDFVLYTSYENIGFSKPNPKFFTAVMERLGADPDKTLAVGNDAAEDAAAAEAAGAHVFLLTDNLINKENADISKYPSGDASALRDYIISVTK